MWKKEENIEKKKIETQNKKIIKKKINKDHILRNPFIRSKSLCFVELGSACLFNFNSYLISGYSINWFNLISQMVPLLFDIRLLKSFNLVLI